MDTVLRGLIQVYFHKLTTITKVTSGSTEEQSQWIDQLYGSIIEAGIYLASTIKVAEASKVIENTLERLKYCTNE